MATRNRTRIKSRDRKKAIHLLNCKKWAELKAFLDEFKGSYAAKLLIESLIDADNEQTCIGAAVGLS